MTITAWHAGIQTTGWHRLRFPLPIGRAIEHRLLSIACASQSESSSSESTSLEYASAAKASRTARREILESRAKLACQMIGYLCGLLELRAGCG
jgi:hypothetical protein